MQVIGKLKLKKETQTFGSNGFQKREIVVTTDDQYSQMIQIELIKDKCSLIDNFNVGDSITVSINLGGREWINPQGEAKYFNSITGWRIEANTDAPTSSFESQSAPVDNGIDNLPF